MRGQSLDRSFLAAKENNFVLLKHSWLPCKSLTHRTDILAAAAASGNQDMMLWLRELVPEIGNPAGELIPRSSWDQITFLAVLEHGHLHLLDWLFKQDCPISYQVLQDAVKRHDLVVVEKIVAHLLKNKPLNWVLSHVLDAALTNNKLDIFDFYKHKMTKRNSDLCLTAVKHNHLAVLKWLRDPKRAHLFYWDEQCYLAALENKNQKVFYWCHKHGCPVSGTEILSALASLYVGDRTWQEPYLYALRHNFPVGNRVPVILAKTRDLQMLQELHSLRKDVTYSTQFFSLLIEMDWTEAMQWALINHPQQSSFLLTQIVGTQNRPLLEWCLTNYIRFTPQNFDLITKTYNLEFLEWGWTHMSPTLTVNAIAGASDLNVIRWCLEKGCLWDKRVLCFLAALKTQEGNQLFMQAWQNHSDTFQGDLRLDDEWESFIDHSPTRADIYEERYDQKESILTLIQKTGNLSLEHLLL